MTPKKLEELNHAVATKVMGWGVSEVWTMPVGTMLQTGGGTTYLDKSGKDIIEIADYSPTTNERDFFVMVDKLNLDVRRSSTNCMKYSALVGRGDAKASVKAPTLPEFMPSVCEAIVKHERGK